ncbi:MAG: sporulation protein YabP [Clostridiales bacterium]|nr:sporulation protein YabP [Clostridiales bacterium]
MDPIQNRSVSSHSLEMHARAHVALTGVSEVIAFDDTQVILMTESGEVALTGQGLHVTKLMLEEGKLTVEGRIDGIFYTDKKERRRGRKGAL